MPEGDRHLGHWDALIPSNVTEEVRERRILEWIEHATAGGKPEFLEAAGVIAYTFRPESLGTRVIIKNDEMAAAFPHVGDGIAYPVLVTDVLPWPSGVEAQIIGRLFGRRRIGFFDTAYWRNAEAYRTGREYHFRLGAIAYTVRPVPDVVWTVRTRELAAQRTYATVSEGDVDDYFFYTAPEQIDGLRIEGGLFHRWWVTLARFDEGNFSVPLYLLASRLDGTVQLADDVEGMLWMQGCLAGPLK